MLRKCDRSRVTIVMRSNIYRIPGLILFIVIIYRVDLSEVFERLIHLNDRLLITVLLLHSLLVALKGIKWNAVLKILGVRLSTAEAVVIYFSGTFVGVATPGKLGEFAKAFYLRSAKGTSITKGFLSVLVDHVFGIYLMFLFSIIGLWQFKMIGTYSSFTILLSSLLVIPFLLFSNGAHLKLLIERIKNTSLGIKVGEVIVRYGGGGIFPEILMLRNRRQIIVITITIITYFVFAWECYLLAGAMRLKIDFISITLISTIAQLISMFPVSIAGIGTRDAAFLHLFLKNDLTAEASCTFSFLIFSVFYLWEAVLGGLAWYYKPLFTSFKSN